MNIHQFTKQLPHSRPKETLYPYKETIEPYKDEMLSVLLSAFFPHRTVYSVISAWTNSQFSFTDATERLHGIGISF